MCSAVCIVALSSCYTSCKRLGTFSVEYTVHISMSGIYPHRQMTDLDRREGGGMGREGEGREGDINNEHHAKANCCH